MAIANDFQPLTVVTTNFVLDATDVLDLPLSRLQYDMLNQSESVFPLEFCILFALAVQISTVTLQQFSEES